MRTASRSTDGTTKTAEAATGRRSQARAAHDRTALARTSAPGQQAHTADVALALLAGLAVGVAGWLVEPLSALLAVPVIQVVYRRLFRRRLRRQYDTADEESGGAPR